MLKFKLGCYTWPPQERRRTASRQRDHPQDLPNLAPDVAAPRRSTQSKPHGKPLWPLTRPAPWGLSVDHPAEGSTVGSQGHRSKPLALTFTIDQTHAIKPGFE